MAKKLEHKSFRFAVDSFDDDTGVFTGYASVFGGVDTYGDTIAPGAFKKTLKEHKNFPLTWTHNEREPLGIVELAEDAKGLRIVRGELNMDVQSAREKRSLAKQGAITGCSIGFRAIKYEINKEQNGRTLREIALSEVALCLFPADDAARINEVKTAGYESLEEFLEATGPWDEQKPYPNEHACRLQEPGKFDRFRRGTREHEGKKYSVIFGHVKGGEDWEEQAYRYAKDTWAADEARTHCKAHDGSFEAAEKCDECHFSEAEPGNVTLPAGKSDDKGAEESVLRSLRALNDELKKFVAIP